MTDNAQKKLNEPVKSGFIKKIKTLFNIKNNNSDDSFFEAIEELIEDEDIDSTSNVASHEKNLISNILDLRDLPVVDIMVPRADIIATNINAPLEELIEILAKTPHSRIPVYSGDMDNIIGVVYIKDMIANIAAGKDFDKRAILRDPLMVSPSMRVMDLLLQLRQSKVHIAFVVDEFGGIDGLITINDLIEVIVGEISDEYNLDIEPQFIERADGTAIADARYAIEDFEEKYGNVFSEDDENEDVDTLGGLIMSIAGYMPTRGEIIKHIVSGIEFEIMEADPRHIIRIRVCSLPKKISHDKN